MNIGAILNLNEQRPHDFFAGGIPQGVSDSVESVPALASQIEMEIFVEVKMRSPVNEFMNSGGTVFNNKPDDAFVAQPGAGGEGVGDVVFKIIQRVENGRDSALSAH